MVTYFYDWSGKLNEDGISGGLVQLCGVCAAALGDEVQKAQRGDEESECEICGAANDAARAAQLDALMMKGGN
jgi:hypothetical protein